MEGGVINIIAHHYTSQTCDDESTNYELDEVGLGMKKLVSIFAWLGAGFACSVLIYTVEVVLGRKRLPTLLVTHGSGSHQVGDWEESLETHLMLALPWDDDKREALAEVFERTCQLRINKMWEERTQTTNI